MARASAAAPGPDAIFPGVGSTVPGGKSIQQRMALVDPPLWQELGSLPGFMSDGWIPLWEQMASYRERAVERGEPLTGRVRVTDAELTSASGPVLVLMELLQMFDLLEVTHG